MRGDGIARIDEWRWNCKVHESRVEMIELGALCLNEDERINLWLAVCQEMVVYLMATHH